MATAVRCNEDGRQRGGESSALQDQPKMDRCSLRPWRRQQWIAFAVGSADHGGDSVVEQFWGYFWTAFGLLCNATHSGGLGTALGLLSGALRATWNALRACRGTVLGLLLDGLRVTLQCIRPCLGTGLELLLGGFQATLQCMRACLKFSIPWNTNG